MSLTIPVLYHWAPAERRSSIIRHGLRPTTPTLIEQFAEEGEGPFSLRPSLGVDTVKAVCLGSSPSHAWSLCGAIWAEQRSTWDLWQVSLDATDLVKPMDCHGDRFAEMRVLNRIPKARVWHVGSRKVASRRWSCA